jgi:hypothetical protein
VEPEHPAVRRGAALLAVEGAALVLVGVVFAVATAVGDPEDRASSYLLAAFAAVGGAVLLLLARGMARRRGWARSPSVVLQLLALPVGIGLLQGGVWLGGVPVLLIAAVTLWQVFAAGVPADD